MLMFEGFKDTYPPEAADQGPGGAGQGRPHREDKNAHLQRSELGRRLHGDAHLWTISLLGKITQRLHRECKHEEAEGYARQLVRASRQALGADSEATKRSQRMLEVVKQALCASGATATLPKPTCE